MTQLASTKAFVMRPATRHDCNITVKLETSFSSIPCQVQNISLTGFMASTTSFASLALGQVVTISQAELGKLQGIVIWTSMGKLGMEFSRPISNAKLSAILK